MPNEIKEIPERFFRQAYETLYMNIDKVDEITTMSAFNHSVSTEGYSPTLTTRSEGFKTAILLVVKDE